MNILAFNAELEQQHYGYLYSPSVTKSSSTSSVTQEQKQPQPRAKQQDGAWCKQRPHKQNCCTAGCRHGRRARKQSTSLRVNKKKGKHTQVRDKWFCSRLTAGTQACHPPKDQKFHISALNPAVWVNCNIPNSMIPMPRHFFSCFFIISKGTKEILEAPGNVWPWSLSPPTQHPRDKDSPHMH